MKIVRFRIDAHPIYGALEDGSERIVALKGDPLFQKAEPSGQLYNLEEARLLSPVIPRSKAVSCCANQPGSTDRTEQWPQVGIKPNTAVIGPDDPIAIPAWGGGTARAFVGLAAVAKTICKNVTPEQVGSVIAGWTIGVDFASGGEDISFSQARAWDTSAAIGPWIVVDPDFNPDNLTISVSVSGQEVASANSADFPLKAAEAFAKVSAMMTLLPGDLVIVGGVELAQPLSAGERLKSVITGVGQMDNVVVSANR